MDVHPYLMAAGLAVFLSVPVGPVGFAAGERVMAGRWREFVLIGLGCITADVVLALLAVSVMHFVPQFDVSALYRWPVLWLVLGAAMVGLGLYLWRNLPDGKAQPFQRPFRFGFGVTFMWPTSFGGIFGAFAAAHMAGWLPPDMGGRLLVALSLGLGTTLLWGLWAYGCYRLRRQQRWGLDLLARVFHRFMAGSVAVGGLLVMLEPFRV